MILTATLNTALDITSRVRKLRPHASHRITSVTERPGGKGLNVARVLAALGHEVTVTGFTGGATGRAVQDQLAAIPGVLDALVPVSGSTRRTIAVIDETAGAARPTDATELNEPGPQITPAEWSAFQDVYVRGNPMGAGDSLVAGLLSGLTDQLPWPRRLTRAVALSTATVLAPAAGEFDRATYQRLLDRVTVVGEATAPQRPPVTLVPPLSGRVSRRPNP